MKREEKQQIRVQKIIEVFTYMVEHNLTQNETARRFHIDRGTMVKWKKELPQYDGKLSQKVQNMSDKNNTKLLVPNVRERTFKIAKTIIKYELTVSQAIIYCDYEVSCSRVAHDFTKYLDENTYQKLRRVLDKNYSEQEKLAQKSRFESLLKQKELANKTPLTDTKKEEIAVNCVKYILQNKASLYQTSKKYNIPKTTMVNWIEQFVSNKYFDLYSKYLKAMEYQRKTVISEKRKQDQVRDTLILAYSILEHSDMSFHKIVGQKFPYISKTQAIRYIYHDLYKIDTTPNKMFYLSVMKQIAKFDRRGIEYSQSKQIIAEVERQMEKNKSQSLHLRGIERKILLASKRLIEGEKATVIAQDMNVDEGNMMLSMEEVLPFINMQMYQLLKNKTDYIDCNCESEKLVFTK